MDKPIVGQIDCIYLPAKNKEATIRWYQEKLGLRWTGVSFDLGGGPEIMLVTPKREEDATLTYKTDDWEGEDYDMHLLTFKSDDIERTHAHLKAQGVSVSEIKLYDGNRKNFRFYDLNGNRLDVWSGWL